MPGPTGDIKWDWTDPKTVTLSNTPPEMQPPVEFGQAAAMVAAGKSPEEAMNLIRALRDPAMGSQEKLHLEAAMNRPQQREAMAPSPSDRRTWRKQLRGINKYIKEGGANVIGGVQELVESGAITVTEDGEVYTAVPFHGNNDALMDAIGRWNDFQGDLQGAMDQRPEGWSPEERQKLFQDMLNEREPQRQEYEYVKRMGQPK